LQGKTWVYRDLFQPDKDNVFKTTITLYDNIYLPSAERDAMIELYSDQEKEYRVFGRWGKLEGRIYKNFNESTHVIPFDREAICQANMPVMLRSIDFGRHLACTWVGLDRYDKAYVVGELKVKEMLLEDFATLVRKTQKELGIIDALIDDTVTDHAFQERLELENYEIYCSPADKAVQYGIEIVRRRLKIHDDQSTNLYVMDNCVGTIEEFQDYQYKIVPVGHEESGEPRKLNDHLMDTVRYNIVELEDYSSKKFAKIESGGRSAYADM